MITVPKLSLILQLMFFLLKLSEAAPKIAISFTPHFRADSNPMSALSQCYEYIFNRYFAPVFCLKICIFIDLNSKILRPMPRLILIVVVILILIYAKGGRNEY